MARDRRRAKQRRDRDRRASGSAGQRTGLAEDAAREPLSAAEDDSTLNAPDPLEHASAEVDLANAQIAMGRPDLADGEFTDDEVAAAELESEGPRGMAADDELDEEADAVTSRRAGRGSRAREILAKAGHDDADGAPPELGDVDDEAALVPHRRARTPVSSNPVIGFLQSSWRELQRVQWPDRRQVVQATTVVLVFCLIAGAYLGVADYLFQRLINAIV